MSRTQKTTTRSKAKSMTPPGGAETMLHAQADLQARIEEVRALQRNEGNFDCFATASGGYCDQAGCLFRSECMSLARGLC